MRKISKRAIGILLALVLCFSMVPMQVMASNDTDNTAIAEQTPEVPGETAPNLEPNNTEDTPSIELGEDTEQDGMTLETELEDFGPTWPEAEQDVVPVNIDVTAENVKVVEKPLVEVVYHYYDGAQSVADFADYAVLSTHSYYALAAANDTGITIAANKYPGIVPVSTDAMRFRVLLNDSEDITALAAYDARTGLVSLPAEYMGHAITIVWYCPNSEAVELPVMVTASVYKNGGFTTTTQEITVASNTGTISVPFTEENGLVVSQGGIDLDESAYSVDGGNLNIATSALGGDIAVTAYTPVMQTMSGGMSIMGATSQVVHTRSADQIFYGYYTSYYTANGNTAFCLDPTVSGLNAGTYNVSGYLTRGTGYDDLIKAAYYLYGGPGYNSVKNNLFDNPDTMEAYGLCHAVASYMWMDNAEAFKGLSNATIQHLLNLIAAINVQAMPPEGFEVFLYNVGSQTNQSLMSWEYTPTGSLKIQKVSSDPEKTDNNPAYSLADGVFGVYNGSNVKLGSITTDANGEGTLDGIAATETGLYILEEKAPKGFAESATKVPFEIVSGQTTTKVIENIPQGDPVTILLKKQDGEKNTNVAQGNASLAGAQFTIKYYKGYFTENELKSQTPARTWIVKTDADGFAMLHANSLVAGSDPLYYASNGTTPTLPLGTVTIQETKAPTGFLINNELFVRQVTTSGKMEAVNTYNEPIVPDNPIRGGVSIQKWDYELNRAAQPQGDADLKATLDIYNRSAGSVEVGGKDYAPGAIVHTLTTDAATGTATTAADLLVYGDYEIVERAGNQPVGYLNTGKISQTFSITNNGEIVNLKTNVGAIKNNIIRGGVYIEKWDTEFDENAPQGDASLDITIEIVNIGKHLVLVDGVEYKPGEVVYTMKLSKDGKATTPATLLPYSTYEAREKSPSTGYQATGVLKRTFTIRKNGEIVNLNTTDTAIKNDVIRGSVYIEKWDNEIDENRAQGAGSLDVTIEIVNIGENHVMVDGVEYQPGEVVYTMTLDKEGRGSTPEYFLPYSTYLAREIAVSEGYLATGVLNRTFTIREHGETVNLNTTDTAIKNDPIRGDLKGVKISDSDGKRLAGVPFEIRSLTTDEAHVIVTDRNGQFDTSSAWNPHSQNTNRGETDRDGIWFGELWTLNDDVGALLYDTYLITELPCEANADRELLSFEVSVYRHNVTIDLGTVTNDYIQTPEIFTTAHDKETGLNDAFVSETTTIVDTVYYSGLTHLGKEYTVKGILMDKATGDPLLIDGQEVTAEKTFRALSENGRVTMEFTFDSLALVGKSVVVFETLEYDGKEVAVHADIEDEGQTVNFKGSEIGTTATGIGGEKELDALTDVKIVDVVSFSGLIPGQTYHLKGALMDKTTGEAILFEDGEPVVAEKTFIANVADGEIEISFTVDGTALKGKSVVVFESLEFAGREIAVHADIEDEGQTVTFKNPEIGTTATGYDGEKEIIPAADTVIVDVVSYKGLAVGKTYTVKGVLMNKATGEPVLVDGKEVTAETKFVAKAESGSVEVVFAFNALALIGNEIVVFENLYYNDIEIAVHADIEDEAQTVIIAKPEIGTTAKAEDGSKVVPIGEAVKVIDTVSYKNIALNDEYIMRGVLMDKETGEAVLIDGKEVTAEKTFVADESGSIDVVFIFDSTGLEGKTLVVFESLEYEGEEIAAHADINDEAQAVTVATPEPTSQTPSTGSGAQTGRDGLPIASLMIAICAVVFGVFIARKRKTNTEQ